MDVSHARVNLPRLSWALSCVKIEPVTKQMEKVSAGLLRAVGLHGHKYVIDATVAEEAPRTWWRN